MSESLLRSILFTHDDLDGAGCRVLFELSNHGVDPSTWKVVNCSNANVDDQVTKVLESGELHDHVRVIFADICCSREVLLKILEKKCSLHIWDHHRTNFWAQTEYPSAQIIPENDLGVMQSGTSIMYQNLCDMAVARPTAVNSEIFTSDYRHSVLIEKFVDTVRSYDTFEWKETGNMEAKRLQVLFQLLGMEKFVERYLDRFTSGVGCTELIDPRDLEFVLAKIEAEQDRIDAFGLEHIIDCTVRGHRTAFALGVIGMNISDLAYQFLKKFPQYDIFASFSFGNGGEFSFRTVREDLNLGEEIAVPMHGGGHPKAAGAPICDELRDVIVDYLISEMNGEAYHFNH